MYPINILDARNNLSALIKRVEGGDEVIIANRGKPVARLVAVEESLEHSAERVAIWLTTNHVTAPGRRSPVELDAQITSEREDWD